MGGGGDNSTIDIFLRIKPVARPSNYVAVDNTENKVEFNIPRDAASGYVNNTREHYEFRFNGILAPEAKQDEVFERVARPVVSGSMEGYNGTIFAYGQTGSGKTFTITGGPERYVDRGIIPRTISAIFSDISKRSDYQFSVHISYLEIYNEIGYDLLDPNREVKSMEDLPQVHLMEDDDQRVHFRNLSVHRANTEEEALNLLFLGDTNRTISETPMNMASSRSHCIFTVYVEARKAGEDIVRRSKLNLVDLAGSERVGKTGVEGTTLREAKFINLSLHYLEQVIIALQERSMGMARPHIPYRNSMMTTVLKDSLGGNCRTVMIATVSPEVVHLDESISTARFAQRVAMVKNVVSLNEEVDPQQVIARLKQEIRDLKEEVRLLRGGAEERGPLTPDEVARLRDHVLGWVKDTASADALHVPMTLMHLRAVHDIFRALLRQSGAVLVTTAPGAAAAGKDPASPLALAAAGAAGLGGKGGGGDASAIVSVAAGPGAAAFADLQDQLRKLKLQVQQRDNEIGILVSMLKRREGGRGPTLVSPGGAAGAADGAGAPPGVPPPPPPSAAAAAGPAAAGRAVAAAGDAGLPQAGSSGRGSGSGGPSDDDVAALMNANLLADRNKAFELFRKSYRQNEVIEENKALLKQKYEAAKGLGAAVNASKQRINELKALIEQQRIQRSVSGLAEGGGSPTGRGASAEETAAEQRAKDLIEREKSKYRESFDQLRDLKKEIEHLHMLLEQSRQRLQRDFAQWLGLMERQGAAAGAAATGGAAALGGSNRPSSALGGASTPLSASLPSWGPDVSALSSSGAFGGSAAAAAAVPGGRGGGVSSSSGSSFQGSQFGGAAAPSAASLRGVDPAVLEAARPFLTGNPDADADIIKFYEAKAKLMQKMGV